MNTLRKWTLALAGVWACAASSVSAQDLTLQESLRRALAEHGSVRAEAAAVAAAGHQAEFDGLAPPLTLSGDLENIAGTGAVSGIRSTETTLRLGRLLELGDKRMARQSVGRAQVDRQRNVLDQRRLDLAARVAHRFIQVLSKQARLQLADSALTLARSSQDAMSIRVKRGRSPQTELDLAELAVLRAELEQEDAEHELASARVTLSVLWGEQEPKFTQAAGDLQNLPEVAEFETLAARLMQSPNLHAFKLEAQQVAAQTILAESARKPDVHAALGVRRLEGIDDQALLFSFSMPLGSAGRASHHIERQHAESERIDALGHAAALEAFQSLYGDYQELLHARHQAETLRDRMIPVAERALSATQAGFAEARLSFLQVAEARSVLLGLQREAIDASARYHRLLADIERATALTGDQP
ncbi:MAG: TolC family protein [Ahniella sp.]|nr:TolC family protein [Ahniella sp.]